MLTSSDKPSSGNKQNAIYWILLCLIIIAAAAIRIRLLDFPLERDEGEFAYSGQLILQMIPPFKVAYTMKLPGTAFVYALIMLLFGQTARGIHFGLLLLNSLTIILLFQVAKRWLNPQTALVACLCYAFLSLSPTVNGFAAHATHFVTLAALAGTLVLILNFEKERLALYGAGGFLFGLAFLMKQQALFLVLFGAYLIVHMGLRSKPLRIKTLFWRLSIFGAGVAIPLLFVLAIAWWTDSLDTLLFWCFAYASRYATAIPIIYAYDSFEIHFPVVVRGVQWLWVMALFGLICLFIDQRRKNVRWLILAFALFSFGAVCPGLYFREHYFIVFLPALALFIGIAVDYLQYLLSSKLSDKSLQYIPLLLFFAVIALGINTHKNYLFFDNMEVLCQKSYGVNPFIESIKIAEFIKSRTNPGDKIAVLGSEPQIFFYSHRKSATGYLYMYGLMETHGYQLGMQREIIKEIEQASPRYLIYVNVPTSWVVYEGSTKLIFSWIEEYTQKYYTVVGIVDRIALNEANYIWDDPGRTYQIQSPYYTVIYERRQVSS